MFDHQTAERATEKLPAGGLPDKGFQFLKVADIAAMMDLQSWLVGSLVTILPEVVWGG